MVYSFFVPGEVVGKARPRMNTRTGKAYTPTKTKLYEYGIRQFFIMEYPNFRVLEGRVKVTIIAMFNIPKSTSKKNKELMLDGKISPTKKPDIDNITKIVLDAMNKFAYKDDTQVVDVKAWKIYSDVPGMRIEVEEF